MVGELKAVTVAMREKVLVAAVAAVLSGAVTQTIAVLAFGGRIDANTAALHELREDVREIRAVLLGPGQ